MRNVEYRSWCVSACGESDMVNVCSLVYKFWSVLVKVSCCGIMKNSLYHPSLLCGRDAPDRCHSTKYVSFRLIFAAQCLRFVMPFLLSVL